MTVPGKVALVTGGAQGIGRAIVQRFLSDGLAVAFVEQDDEAGREAAAELGDVMFVPGDVSREDQAAAAVEAVRQRFGQLDVLVNNAGISRFRPLAQATLEDWERVIGTNLTGPFLMARQAAPLLAASPQGGVIVNIASTRALMSEPGTEAYAASKGGLVALTHALALSLGPTVRVNCVSPGWIDVSGWKKGHPRPASLNPGDHLQHPAGRVGRPEDVAALVAWLAGPEAGFMTGANLVLDGGMTRKMIYQD